MNHLLHPLCAVLCVLVGGCSTCPSDFEPLQDDEAFAGVSLDALAEKLDSTTLFTPITWSDGTETTLRASLAVRPGSAFPGRSGTDFCDPVDPDTLQVLVTAEVSTDDGRLVEELDEVASMLAWNEEPTRWIARLDWATHRLEGTLPASTFSGCPGMEDVEAELHGTEATLNEVTIQQVYQDERDTCRSEIASDPD